MKPQILIQKDEKGMFVATVPSLPGCISQGKTKREAMANIKKAIEIHANGLKDWDNPQDERWNTV